jgi:two-component system response regulator YesN
MVPMQWEEAAGKIGEIIRQLEQTVPMPQEQQLEAGLQLSASLDQGSRQLKEWSYLVLETIRREIEPRSEPYRQSIVRKVRTYLQTHLSEDVSLQVLAAHVHMNPSHLCRIYKQETGEGIRDFLLRHRMEKARTMLAQTNMKVYEIGAALGYAYTPYFIRVFRKYFGVTPQELREFANRVSQNQ